MTDSKKVSVKCTVPNIWTSEGKLLKGESVSLDEDEAKKIKAAMKAMNSAG